MPNIGWMEILIILGIVILLFGASRLPKLGRSMGQGMRGFKDGLQEGVKGEPDKALPKGADDAGGDDAGGDDAGGDGQGSGSGN